MVHYQHPEILPIKEKLKGLDLDVYEISFTLLILENLRKPNPDSIFKYYFQLLPKDMSTLPIFYTDEVAIKLLNSTKFLKAVVYQEREDCIKEFEILKQNNTIDHNVTQNEYILAWKLYKSRNFACYENDEKFNTLIPFADLFNYQDERNIVEWEYNENHTAFEVKARNNIQEGEEVILY